MMAVGKQNLSKRDDLAILPGLTFVISGKHRGADESAGHSVSRGREIADAPDESETEPGEA